MAILPVVLAAAAVWHVGIAILVRQRTPRYNRPPLTELLVIAEKEVLHALNRELARKKSDRGENPQESEGRPSDVCEGTG